MTFKKHLTSCLYKISGFHHSFTEIDLDRQLIYLNEGGINSIPVRLADVENVHVTGLGELKIVNGKYEWVE
ncbi:hypothetical protein CVD28_24890 [Bacillus sp. M6-12]|uniref:hypothetical protein n=1 Tax=Bacillus sp. M6-12 TaxID=2054166 RepID=UPI000C763D0A|nr:hypothetical protein [Bacillus sp. M6-12]PLS15075.1 hypothetical protein CVD28_24890 [Bacillus sp. M6-12]